MSPNKASFQTHHIIIYLSPQNLDPCPYFSGQTIICLISQEMRLEATAKSRRSQ